MTLLDQIGGPEGDLLGLQRLLGAGGLGADGGAARRTLMLRFQSPPAIRESLERLHAAGFRGLTVMGEGRLFEAVGRHGSKGIPALLPIVPNLQGFMRDAVEYGMLGAGLRRAWRVGPLALAGLGIRGVSRVPALARREFPAMMRSFIELELADFARYHPPVVFLQAQMTDLALAMHNPRILEAYFQAVRDRTGALAGVATQNFGPLVSALKSWGMEPAAVLAPWNASGANMRPDATACVHAAKASGFPIWADRMGRPDPPTPEDRATIKKAGLAGAVRDDYALWLNS
jgi:hypothetical protein